MILIILMLRALPTSTLFPYTTLFRSTFPGVVEAVSNKIDPLSRSIEVRVRITDARGLLKIGLFGSAFVATERSEEHTSELQSLRHLVCRLLLEKKKTT